MCQRHAEPVPHTPSVHYPGYLCETSYKNESGGACAVRGTDLCGGEDCQKGKPNDLRTTMARASLLENQGLLGLCGRRMQSAQQTNTSDTYVTAKLGG